MPSISYHNFIVVAAVSSWVWACHTPGPKGGVGGQDSEIQQDQPGLPGDQVPAALWSVPQRQAAASYHFLVAEYLGMDGEYQQSLDNMQTAYDLDPNPFVGAQLLGAKAVLKEPAEVLPEARKMVLFYPKSQRLRYLYGVLLSKAGYMAESFKQLEKAVELDPREESPYIAMIELHEAQGDLLKSIVIAKELVKALPGSLAGHALLSRLYLATGQKKAALAPARRAYEMQSSNPELVLVYALALEYNGESRKAIKLYENLYRLNPTNDKLVSRLIALYRKVGGLEEALNLLNELARIETDHGSRKPGVQMQRAIILWELERFQEAADILVHLTEQHPKSDRIAFMAAIGQERVGNFDRSLEFYERVSDNSEFYEEVLFRKIVVFRHLKRFGAALENVEKMINLENSPWDLLALKAGILADQEHYDAAIEFLQELQERKDLAARAMFLTGVYLERQGKIDACIGTMKKVIALDPQNSSAFNYLGYLYAERGIHLQEAERLIKKALELKPGDGYYLDSLGWVYYQQKDYQKALQYLTQALKKEPGEGIILEHIGDALRALGRESEGLEYYRKALQSKLEQRDRQRVEDKLRQLTH